jgi:hypothetical protein
MHSFMVYIKTITFVIMKVFFDIYNSFLLRNDNVEYFDGYVVVNCIYLGHGYKVYLPFNVVDQCKYTENYLVMTTPNEVEKIDTIPGVPYFISPSDLGVDSLDLFNTMENTFKTFKGEEIPCYL